MQIRLAAANDVPALDQIVNAAYRPQAEGGCAPTR